MRFFQYSVLWTWTHLQNTLFLGVLANDMRTTCWII